MTLVDYTVDPNWSNWFIQNKSREQYLTMINRWYGNAPMHTPGAYFIEFIYEEFRWLYIDDG